MRAVCMVSFGFCLLKQELWCTLVLSTPGSRTVPSVRCQVHAVTVFERR